MDRTLARYLALQLPGLAALLLVLAACALWFGLDLGIAAAVLAVWVLKDLALYPLVRRAYERRTRPDRLVGRTGVAEEPLAPAGWVRVGGELWRATLAPGAPPVAAGGAVRIRELRGLQAIVEPAAAPSPRYSSASRSAATTSGDSGR